MQAAPSAVAAAAAAAAAPPPCRNGTGILTPLRGPSDKEEDDDLDVISTALTLSTFRYIKENDDDKDDGSHQNQGMMCVVLLFFFFLKWPVRMRANRSGNELRPKKKRKKERQERR